MLDELKVDKLKQIFLEMIWIGKEYGGKLTEEIMLWAFDIWGSDPTCTLHFGATCLCLGHSTSHLVKWMLQ